MKTIDYFLIICLCLCLSACNSNDKPEVENPMIEEPVIEEPEVEEPEIEEPCPCLAFLDASNSNDEPELEEPEIEEPCPDLADINPHFAYGDIPNLAARLAYMGMERPADSYNYPLYSAMEEYAELTNGGRDFGKFCQVTPACLFRKMSTQAVIQAIWEMPRLSNIFLYDPYLQRGIEGMRHNFNAFEELFNRKDAGAALLERLTLVDPLTPSLPWETEVLEALLSRPEFLSQLNESEKRKTVEITLSADEKRQIAWPPIEGGYQGYLGPRRVSTILMGKAMYAACYCPFLDAMNADDELKYYIEGWRPNASDPSKRNDYIYFPVYYGNIPDLIIDYAKNFINN